MKVPLAGHLMKLSMSARLRFMIWLKRIRFSHWHRRHQTQQNFTAPTASIYHFKRPDWCLRYNLKMVDNWPRIFCL
ncbi:UNVERIFIED_CONTAM: hypothetical protein GTU68_005325 [Idotea baltica]|nr:hypothetical protein [Idotea baltica]